MEKNLLSIHHLTFGWEAQPIFSDVCCQLGTRDIIQLSGENGAGKTTLLQIISGMIPHFNRGKILQGEVRLKGRSIFQSSPKKFFPDIAFVPSRNLDFFLLTESLEEELVLARSILKLDDSIVAQRQQEFLAFFPQLVELQRRKFKNMDFNQKVVALTFVFYLQNASLFLFDEILNAFPSSELENWFSFFNWLSSNNCGVIFVNHNQRDQRYPQWILADKKLLSL